MNRETDERIEELLVERSLHGLDTAAQTELSRLLGGREDDGFELAAAAVQLAFAGAPGVLPEHLGQSLERLARRFLAGAASGCSTRGATGISRWAAASSTCRRRRPR